MVKRYLLSLGIALCFGQAASAGSNESHIEQAGDGSVAEVRQNDASGDRHNSSDISQIGTGNQAVVDQFFNIFDHGSNASGIVQSGTRNLAEINQTSIASLNRSTVEQLGAANAASVVQGGFLTENISIIEQTGDGQEARVTQFGGGLPEEGPPLASMDSRIIQTGFGNKAQVEQRAQFNKSAILQEGTNQNAEVRQDAFSSLAESRITQSGAANAARVVQNGDFSEFASEIHMDGSFNQTDVRQGAGGIFEISKYQSLITIDGGGNSAGVLQTGFEGQDFSNITLAGNGNDVLLEQRSQAGTATSDILVNGASNRINVTQDTSSIFDFASNDNLAQINVDGTGNQVDIVQRILPVDGIGGTGGNRSQIEVDGASNQISVEQDILAPGANGVNDYAIHTVGNGNVIHVTQQQ